MLSTWLPFGSIPIAAVLLAFGFVGLRFCGMGMLTMTSRTMLGKWFEQRRGRVSSIQGIFTAFGFASAPYGFSQAIAAIGWRNTWLILASVKYQRQGISTPFERPMRVVLVTATEQFLHTSNLVIYL